MAYTDHATLNNCHQVGLCMDNDRQACNRKSSLRYKIPFKSSESTIKSRGLSFRGRGVLDVQKGWKKASEYTELGITGDISDTSYDPVAAQVSFIKELDHPSKPKFIKIELASPQALPAAIEFPISYTKSINQKTRIAATLDSTSVIEEQNNLQTLSNNNSSDVQSILQNDDLKIIIQKLSSPESDKPLIASPQNNLNAGESNSTTAILTPIEQKSKTSSQHLIPTQERNNVDVEEISSESKIIVVHSPIIQGNQLLKSHEKLDSDSIGTDDEWIQEEKEKRVG